jgi:hypothetical protein
LARLAERSTAAEDAAAWPRTALQARVKIGMALRQALAQAGIDPAMVAMLRISDDAAQELAMTANRPDSPDAAATSIARERALDGSDAMFETRIDALSRHYRARQVIDFAQASLGEALAWCLAQLESSRPR